MNGIIKNRIGFSFPGLIVFMGFTAMLSSLFIMVESPILGLLVLILGSFLGTSSYGSEIDVINNRFREYGSVFGIKKGKWFNLNSMPFLGIFKSRSGYLIYGRSTNSTTVIDDYFDVCLMSNSHRKRIVLQKFKTKEEALNFTEMLEKKIEVKLTTFNPLLSKNNKE